MHRPPATPDESSIRYAGWRVVAVCFVLATFGWGFGFYGHSVYLAELQRLHGWPASLISGATTFFYLFGALAVAFVSEAMRAVGPRHFLLAGVATMALAVIALGRVDEPWQLYPVYALLALGWAGTSLGAITTALGLWFDRRRGMAISLALNGASFGGVVGAPLLIAAIAAFGLGGALLTAALAMVAVLTPAILMLIGTPPVRAQPNPAQANRPSGTQVRARALRDRAFLTLTIAYSLVLFAQVGFIVHLISFLDPVIGRGKAAVAVSLLTAMAVVGRVLVSTVIDRLNQRLASALSFVSQSVALLVIINTSNGVAVMAACALFGFSVGNLITLPALIVQREFAPQNFGVLISLVTAVTQVAYAFGPGIVGVLRDTTGSYTLPFALCIAVQWIAAALIMARPKTASGV